MDIDSLHKIKGMVERKRALERELKQLVVEIARLEEVVLNQFIDSGVDAIKVDGSTLYLHKQVWAGVAEGYTKEQAVDELKEVGLGDYVHETFNVNSLSAYYREAVRETDDFEIPKSIKLEERYSIRMRK